MCSALQHNDLQSVQKWQSASHHYLYTTAQLDACSVALQLEAETLNATIPQIFPLLPRALLGINVDRSYVYANHAQ